MKNIHLIPTDKPSRIYLIKSNNRLGLTSTNPEYMENFGSGTQNQNIYITSDEKFNRDEYVTDGVEVIKATPKLVDAQGLVDRRDWKKIILTTDQDLIDLGVQSIDDEFLQWYIKNPSCENVLVTNLYGDYNPIEYFYEIITPKEEPKQITSLGGDGLGGIPKGILTMLIGEKEETLKEAAEKYVNINVAKNAAKLMYKEHFIAGAKWQQQRSYSGEEAFNLLMEFSSRDRNSSSGTPHSIAKWFEQFKK